MDVSGRMDKVKKYLGTVNNTKKYHVFAPMGRFQINKECLKYKLTPTYATEHVLNEGHEMKKMILQDRNINIIAGTTVENKEKN